MNAFKNPLKNRPGQPQQPAATVAASPALPPAQPVQQQARPQPVQQQAQVQQARPQAPVSRPLASPVVQVRPPQLHDPKSPPRDAEMAFEATKLLSALLAEENAALQVHNITKVAALSDRKETLVHLYNDQMEAIAANPSVLAAVPPERKTVMKAVAEELRERIGLNARLLKGNLEAARRVMKIIVEATREEQAKASPYGPRGAINKNRKTGQPYAMAFNKAV
ncbi:MAG: hypothetical protein HQL37_02910 [Alphaproteobacteria bacterium]|nr:hypothetical protein [Alphaproteobacteria bacterium]